MFSALKIFLSALLLATSIGCTDREPATNSKDRSDSANTISIDSGYASGEQDWRSFLTCWRTAVQARLARGESYTSLKSLPPSLNQVSATTSTSELAVADAERRLNVKLPASYRHFVLASGNAEWFIESFGTLDGDGKLSNVSAIDVYPLADPKNFGYWSSTGPDTLILEARKYLRYGYHTEPLLRQDSAYFRIDQLDSLIKVGDLDQGGAILLNPKVISADGEMEAWLLSFKSGASRYRSFAELMQNLAYLDIQMDKAQSSIATPNVLREVECTKMLVTAASR
ncbi:MULTISPECIES: SMI1/KNR4 family protein [Methylomonas]|uniref:SMI1/KNR4 family protein n=1 Tax=Methylomonas TaxID=416 RepID=UPI00104B5F01|nr:MULTISPECIES: SMI1/KNR4 family protein [Methylomonas]